MIWLELKTVMEVKIHIATVILITMYLIQIVVNVQMVIKRYLIYVKVRPSISSLSYTKYIFYYTFYLNNYRFQSIKPNL